ncbi:sensor histidine kinase [Pseudonocardia bannensis]|uniref:Uncharacterized protein n=1 Tax=Pseudonocardia bannensis TaxID=630973 RepID=A0A848DCU6_9PSEU|nr:histidine kinase [Pseudonocardia bannensis]NMH90428.1 hypothetical protein [Pseudonocardia bannensis]
MALRTPVGGWPAAVRARVPAPSASVDSERLTGRGLALRYAGTAVVTLLLVALGAAYVSRALGIEEAIDDARRMTRGLAQIAVEPVLRDGLLTGDPEAIAALDAVVRGQVMPDLQVRVKLWDRSGTVLYSDEPRLIGEHFGLGADQLESFATGTVKAELSNLSEPENRFEEPANELLEVYLPVRTPNGTMLLLECYYGYESVTQAGQKIWFRFAPYTLGSLVLLSLAQAPIAVALARRLRRNQRQREALLRQAIEATDTERRRIAADLHDGVVQDLAGVAFSLGAATRSGGADVQQSREAADRVRQAVKALRSLLVEIYPPNLYEEGLAAALADLAAGPGPRGIRTELAIETPLDDLGVDETELIYRVAQEGLRNVVAHARASRVDIRVHRRDRVLVLSVADDGSGMDLEHLPVRPGHLGLRALADLAHGIGAGLTVESALGAGTTLRLEVPVP